MRISGDSGGNELGKTPASPVSMVHWYRHHEPEKTALYPIIEQHLSALTGELTRQHGALPAFVIDEFRNYLRCGRLEHGFIRVKCDGCRHEHLVAFSCKRRGFCQSCGARRMIETSAHLVDHVIPDVPVRQWVLSFPWPLRLLFASRPDALSRCLAVITRVIETGLIQRAGLTRASRARTGVVTLIQRFGSALNLNVHLHMIILDGGAGGRTLTLKNPGLQRTEAQPKPFTVDRDGFSVNAAVACQPHQRQRLERLCRYVTRPAICLERLSTDAAGQVIYELKHPFRDGTTHILFTPQDFLARLAALVPRPRANLTRYHGVFAPNSPFRSAVVPGSANPAHKKRQKPAASTSAEPAVDQAQPTAPLTWAERLKRVFDIDISVCPLCGGTLRVIADLTNPDVIQTILAHLKQRAPPGAAHRQTPLRAAQKDLFAAN